MSEHISYTNTLSSVAMPMSNVSASSPLHYQVTQALQSYFAHLGDVPPTHLYELVIKEVETALLQVVLEKAGGNQTKAAVMLGLSRTTLRKKLNQYGIE